MTLDQSIRSIIAEEVAAAEKRIIENLPLKADRDLSFSEALEYLHISEYTLRKLCRSKRIPHRTYGAEGSKSPRYWFSTTSLDAWKRQEEQENYRPGREDSL